MRPLSILPVLAILALGSIGCDGGPRFTEPEPIPEREPPCLISLAVGQTASPSPGGAACRLSPALGAEYVLAVLDGRAIQSARESAERGFGSYQVTVALGLTTPPLVGGGSAAPAPSSHAMHLGDVHVAAAAHRQAEQPALRETPWALGEDFQLYDPIRGASVAARVVRVYPDGMVAAWIKDDRPDLIEAFLDQLDYAVATVQEHGLPLLRHSFVPRLPVTSTGSGQYLMVLGVDGAARGRARFAAAGDTLLTWITLNIDTEPGPVSLASLLAHEMTHSYQGMYMHDTRPAGAAWSSIAASFWAQEGGANLISFEMIRRLAGLDLHANYDWRAPPASRVFEFYSLRAQPGSGEFTKGYDNAKGFLRALVIQRVQAGESVEDAVREVSRGAIEGWYVNDGSPRQGLAPRMRVRLGGAWDPAEALLDWTLSYAADDITPNPAYQDPSFLRIWDLPSGHPVGWRPAAVLAESGTRTVTFERFGGSSHYLHLRDGGNGVGFSINSNSPTLHWKLIRIR